MQIMYTLTTLVDYIANLAADTAREIYSDSQMVTECLVLSNDEALVDWRTESTDLINMIGRDAIGDHFRIEMRTRLDEIRDEIVRRFDVSALSATTAMVQAAIQ